MINNNLFPPLCSLIFINLFIHRNFLFSLCVSSCLPNFKAHHNGNYGGLKENGPQKLWHYDFRGVCMVLEEVCHCRGLCRGLIYAQVTPSV